jgi:hypothetical protein
MKNRAIGISLLAAVVSFGLVAPTYAGYIGDGSAANNGAGVYYNGELYVFWPLAKVKSYKIENCLCLNGDRYDGLPSPGGSSYAQVAPLVIENVLWLFHTGNDSCLYYKTYDDANKKWDSSWHPIPNVSTKNDYEIAPVYNPQTHRLAVYYFYSNYIWWVYSDDYGATWSAGQRVLGLELVISPPSAVFCPGARSDTLLAVSAIVNLVFPAPQTAVRILTLSNGSVTSYTDTAWHATGRPFLVDVNDDYYALTWKASDTGRPWLAKMAKATGVWQAGAEAIAHDTEYSPTAVVKYVLKEANGPWYGQLYLIWGDGAITRPVLGSWAVSLIESWPITGP